MKTSWRFVIFLIWISASAISAEPQGSNSHANSATANSDWSEFTGSMQKMHAAIASLRPSGNNDVDFVKLMLPHHQAAVDMAKIQLLYGKDPQMRRLAQEIVTDQQSEIELMQLWLRQHAPQKTK